MDIIVAFIVGVVLGVIGTKIFQKPKPVKIEEPQAPYKLDLDLSTSEPTPVTIEIDPMPDTTIPAMNPDYQNPDVTTPVLKFPAKPKKTIKAAKKPISTKPKKKK